MICIETEYFRLTRILLLAIGLWPYERSLFARIQWTSCFAILTAFIIFQITALWTPECTLDLAIKILSCVLFFTAGAIKYNSFRVKSYTVMYLLDHLKHICDGLRDKNEIDIVKKYGNNATRYTIKITLLTLVCVCVTTLLPISSLLLDIVLPTNKSRFVLPIVLCYFIDQEKYFYLILLHTSAAICIQALVIIGIGTFLVSYLKHACGMFNIVRYRIQKAMTTEKSEKYGLDNKNAICKRIVYGVDIHRSAMESSTCLMFNFETMFFLIIAVSVASLSLNLFLVFRTAVDGNNVMELLFHLTFVIVILLYMFLANYVAQDISDHYDEVFKTVYSVQWYEFPIKIQKMILFLLQRGTKSFHLHLGGIFIGSIESAVMLMSTSISYFTVLYSIQ